MTDNLVNLRADVAMREEDYRIAAKHREQAAARPHTDENVRALFSAEHWEATCYERWIAARGAHIRAMLDLDRP